MSYFNTVDIASFPVSGLSTEGFLKSVTPNQQVTGTLSGVGQTIEIPGEGAISVGIDLTGTWVATLIPEYTVNGTDWHPTAIIHRSSIGVFSLAQSITAPEPDLYFWPFSAGLLRFRLRVSSYPSGIITEFLQGTGSSVSQQVMNVLGPSFFGVTATQGPAGATPWPVSFQTPQPVSGTFWQATQPVSGTFFQATQPVSVAATVNTDLIDNSTRLLGTISLGVVDSKTVVGKTGSLVTTATTADQVVLTYTVTTGKTFYLQDFDAGGYVTALPNTDNPVKLGTLSLENPSGTKLITEDVVYGIQFSGIQKGWAEPLPFASGTVLRA